MSAPNERPILMSASMVRAILAGTKTQTRRIMKPQPAAVEYYLHGEVSDRLNGMPTMREADGQGWGMCGPFRCPYIAEGMFAGAQGKLANSRLDDDSQRRSMLWVREEHFRFGHWVPVPGVRTKKGRQKWAFVADTAEVRYLDNPPAEFRKGRHHKDVLSKATWYKRLARFMPKSICRIRLKVESVRVERLQEISEADAIAEGALKMAMVSRCDAIFGHPARPEVHHDGIYTFGYSQLWESINGAGSWAANPWVWVVTFSLLRGQGVPAAPPSLVPRSHETADVRPPAKRRAGAQILGGERVDTETPHAAPPPTESGDKSPHSITEAAAAHTTRQ